MHRQWVKLWRRAEDSLICQPYRWQLFSWLLVKAAHTSVLHRCHKARESVMLQPGQLVVSSRLLAKKLNRPRASIQRDLEWMVKQKMVKVAPLGWGTLVTVKNWKMYQNPDQAADTKEINVELVEAVLWDINDHYARFGIATKGREGKQLKGGKQFSKLVMARVNQDGATLEDFQTVHRNKFEEWAGTEMARFLQPSTLYALKHWDDYLNPGDGGNQQWTPPKG